MADGVSVFDSAVWKKNSVIPFVIRLFTDGSIDGCLPFGSILRMHAPQPFFPRFQGSDEQPYQEPFEGLCV
jgi:hypothetical protein